MGMPTIEPMRCRRCNAVMRPGTALMNAVVAAPDFTGDTGAEAGSTRSATGPAVWVPVLKCPACGHSIAMDKQLVRAYQPTAEEAAANLINVMRVLG